MKESTFTLVTSYPYQLFNQAFILMILEYLKVIRNYGYYVIYVLMSLIHK